MKRVYVLLGGMVGVDGSLFSRGMADLAVRIARIPDVICTTHYWTSYWNVVTRIKKDTRSTNNILVGYSGGGSRATWVTRYVFPRVIDLVVGYDPSPISSMLPFRGNVKEAICYSNKYTSFGLGAGRFMGIDNMKIITLNETHLAVQYDEMLHSQTLVAIAGI